MKNNRMYQERKANVSAFRGCSYSCTYCAFRSTLRRSLCEKCQTFVPHAHLEVLRKRPPTTEGNEFLTIGLTGDISYASDEEMAEILHFCNHWHDRTFLIQSKNPAFFLDWQDVWPDNAIAGTTIETDKYFRYNRLSGAPYTIDRYKAIKQLQCRKAITIEPIIYFEDDLFVWITDIQPEWIWLGYDSRPEINRLPEPRLAQVQELIHDLTEEGIEVRQKLIRKAWDED